AGNAARRSAPPRLPLSLPSPHHSPALALRHGRERAIGMADSATHESTLHRDISRAMIRLTHEYTGRGPTRARTTINGTLVAIILEDTLTKGERTLLEAGQAGAV